MSRVESTLGDIRRQLAAMRAVAADGRLDLAAPDISAWCPSEHLDHLLKVTTAIVGRIAGGETLSNARGISLLGRIILIIGRIPRGRGKAPERMHGARVDAAALDAALDEAERLVDQLDASVIARRRDPAVRHPRFGGLTPAQALRFVSIHHEHHLRIIDDIVARARGSAR